MPMRPEAASPLSIVVLTYNRSDALAAVLHGLASQSLPPGDVVVTDDGSNAEHRQIILELLRKTRWPFQIRYVWHPDVGFTAAAARNQGARIAQSDYVVFLDGDCVPLRDFVLHHTRLRRLGCFVNGSRILLDETLSRQIIRDPKLATASAWYWLKQRLRGHSNKWLPMTVTLPPSWHGATETFRWKGIRSCNFGLWRQDLAKVNGFDEAFVGWGHEDADLVWRLHRAGLSRINGYWSTEVLHLWHSETPRDRDADNAQRVRERMSKPNYPAYAAQGYNNTALDTSSVLFAN